MAISITQEPQVIAPSNNPLIFVFESDQTGQPNFSYYVEVYINSQLHSAHQVFREYNNSGKIDVSQILRGITSTPAASNPIDQSYTAGFINYSITVYEKYGSTPALQLMAASNVKVSFNGSLKHDNWIGFNYELYDPRETDGSYFLTDFPRDQKALCRYDSNFLLGTFTRRANQIPPNDLTFRLFVDLYDITGGLIANDAILLNNYRMRVVNVGPYQIVANSTITSINYDTCYFYDVRIQVDGAFGTHSTEKFRIYFDQSCERYDPVRLTWLNKYGVYDQFSFDLVSQDSANITAQDYMSLLGEWASSDGGDAWSYALYQAEKKHYTKEVTEFTLINSDWIKQHIQHWLVESLLESPRVYIEVGEDRYEPVKVNTANYTKKLKRKDGLIQEQVLLERTYQYVSQLN